MKPAPRQWGGVVHTLWRTFGARGIALRAAHELRRRAGRFRLTPRYVLADAGEPLQRVFQLNAAVLGAATDPVIAAERGRAVASGRYEAYRWEWRPLPTGQAGWHSHPRTGRSLTPNAPWWRIAHLDRAFGDIKDLWEPARFAWVYDLVRAHRTSRDPQFAEAFVDRFVAWADANPPFLGAHWSCGQEVAIRAVALLYAESNFDDAPAMTSAIRSRLAGTLAASGERIADAIGYAISQRNNHAISEACGLVVLGARLARVHPEAQRWYARGWRLLNRLVIEQFAEDGWYIQHSFNYLRLALDQCVVAERALRSRGDALSPLAVGRLAAAAELLRAVICRHSGEVPNHGANDGAFVHPITLAKYRDYRPVLTAVSATFGLPYPSNLDVDRETLAWLGAEISFGPALQDGVICGASGWASARVGRVQAFFRAGRYRSRPGHLDPLQLDVRFGGTEWVVDPGSYSYNTPPPWHDGLTGALFHNGPMLNDEEPGVRGPRFLWYSWPSAELGGAAFENGTATMTGEISGRVRRVVRLTQSEITISDVLIGDISGDLRVRWLVAPGIDPSVISVDGKSSVVVATEEGPMGWFSPCYGLRLRSRIVLAEAIGGRGTMLTTRIVARRLQGLEPILKDESLSSRGR